MTARGGGRFPANATERSAIVTGASSGIGFALARMLGREGHALTIAARRPDKLEAAATALRDEGFDVKTVAGDIGNEQVIKQIVVAHKERHNKLDVLVNNAGVGTLGGLADVQTKHLDLQVAINFRSVVLLYREALELLRAAATEHRNALVINTSSISGIFAQSDVAVYGATKAAVLSFTVAMNRELSAGGIKSTAICPAYVATPMTALAGIGDDSSKMITPEEIAVVVQALLRLSPNCLVPEIRFERPGDGV